MKKFFRNLLDDRWTLVGMGAAWIVLEGTAKTIMGWAILATIVAGGIYIGFKKEDE